MPHKPTELVPEPAFSAYHHILRQVALFLRSRPELSPDQLFDLGDALHNVPEFLIDNHDWSEEKFRRMYLQPYDDKLSSNGKGFSLVGAVDEGMREALQRERKMQRGRH